MKKILILLVLLVGSSLVGCAGVVRGVGDTREERALRINQGFRQQWRMFVDDWDYLWLVEQPSTLTSYRVGN